MTELSYGLPPQHLAAAFPFHLVLNRALQIVQAGQVLQRVAACQPGASFESVFSLTRPKIPLKFDALCHEQHSFFLLQTHQGQLQLKGQMLFDPETDTLIFLGAPWLTEFHQVEQLGLKLSDFAPHDSLVHYLSLLQTKNTALNEANRLAEKLRQQGAELSLLNRELAIQQDVTRVLAEAGSLHQAAPKILQVIGEGIDWQFGAVWLVDTDQDLLRCVETWSAAPKQHENFTQLSRQLLYQHGQGLPGRVWAGAAPLWINDEAADSGLPRLAAARQCDLSGAFGFPFFFNNTVLGVIEFFSRESYQPDPQLLTLAANIGSQLGQFIERQHAEKALLESEARKGAILESAMDCIVTMDHHGRVTEFNPAAERVFGFGRAEAVGQLMSDLIIPKQFRQAHKEGLKRYLATGEHKVLGQRIEITALRKDGSEFPVDLAITSFEHNGQPMFTGYLRDITEAYKAREELSQAKEAAEAASLAKGQFLATMSHEIRTPLNAIIGMTELAMETSRQDERTEFLQTIQTSSELLLYLINDILDFSKIEAGQMDIEAIAFDPVELVESVIGLMAVRAQSKGLVLRSELGDHLPASLLGDPNRLRQILLNLVSNAIKFTETGEVVVIAEVVVSYGQPNQGVELHFAVRDTGIGIAPEHHERIFDKFCQADLSTTRRYGGTGLGLSISNLLVELMRGRIWLESAPGNGSTFHISIPFPLVQQNRLLTVATPSPDLIQSALTDAITQPPVPKRILLVEDSEANQQLALRILQKAGYVVDLAVNGQRAVEQVQACRYDLILMDIQMPVMDGFAATTAIRQHEQQTGQESVPIIALTAHAIEGYRERCLESGMDDYLTKPIKRDRLLETIEECLAKRHVVLVVEDTAENQKLIKKYLKDEPLRVLFAHNGRQALDVLARRRVSLVLLDMEMPILNGYETVRELRTHYDANMLPVIALTAHEGEESRSRCLAFGCNDFLSKPFKKTRLIELLRQTLYHQAPPAGQAATLPQIESFQPNEEFTAWVDEDILDLIPDYLNDRRQDVRSILDSIQSENYAKAQTLGHNMKGSGSAYGFGEISAIGKSIENAARQCDSPTLSQLCSQLEDYLHKVQVKIRQV